MMMSMQTDQCHHSHEMTNQNRPSVIVENTFQFNDGTNAWRIDSRNPKPQTVIFIVVSKISVKHFHLNKIKLNIKFFKIFPHKNWTLSHNTMMPCRKDHFLAWITVVLRHLVSDSFRPESAKLWHTYFIYYLGRLGERLFHIHNISFIY